MKKHRWLAWLLSIAMLLSMLPVSAMAQEADTTGAQSEQTDTLDVPTEEPKEAPEDEPTEEPTEAPNREPRRDGTWTGAYLDCDENGENWVTKTCTEGATVLTSTMTAWNAGWYVASGAVTFDSNITVTGDVKLILEDGATLTAGNCIYVTEGNSLTVYAQSTGDSMGKLVGQRIGAKADKGGTLTFNGGRLTFKTGTPMQLSEGSLTVNGGYVEAASTSDVAIGSDTRNYRMGTVTINGGTLIATTPDENHCAIGHYWSLSGSPAVLNINGGTLITSSGYGGIHSNAIINLNADYDCRISLGESETAATTQEYSAREVDRAAKYFKIEPCEKHTSITGVSYRTAEGHVVDGCRFCGKGTIEAHSYDAETNLCICGAWRGSYQACDENGRNWETKEISGVRVLTNAESLRDGGIYVLCGDTTLSKTDSVRIQKDLTLILADGANITANGGLRVNEAGSLTIYAQSAGDNMGKLTANGGYLAAGIGGNSSDAPGPIKIYGGEINANGGAEAAGIGGGSDCAGGELTIYGGKVTAIGYQYTPGIGGGESYEGTNAGGTVTIYGGTVIAKGCGGARSIGSAYGYIRFGTYPRHTGGSGGTLTLNGGTLYLLRGWGDIEETDVYYRAPQILEAAPIFSTEVGWLQSFGTNENDLAPIYAGDLTGEEYTSYAAAKFEVCPHDPNAGAEYIDEQTHAASCTWCGLAMGSTTAHSFDENGNCACGAWQATVLDCDENGENWTTKTVVGKNRLEAPESGTVVTLDAGWYIASDALVLGDENTDFTVQLNGDVKLLLRDGNSITVNGTIESTDANGTLTVYGQSAGDGKGDLFVNGRIDSDLVVKGGSVVVEKPDGFAAAGEAGTIYGPLNGSFTLIGGAVTVSAMNEDTVLPKFVPTMKDGAGLKFSGGATMGELVGVAASDFAALTDYRAYHAVRFEVCTDHIADESNASYPVKVDNAQHKSICKWCGNEYLVAHEYDEVGLCECGAGGVNYRVYNEVSKKWEQKQCNDFTFVTSDTVSWENGWYVVAGSVSISESVYVVGDVHLILRDNASLWIAKGIISYFSGSTLTIYAQSAPSIGEDGSISNGSVGTLRVKSSNADIMDGGYGISCDGGLTVMGGILDIKGTYNAIRYKLNAYGGRIEAEVPDLFQSAFGETPELCGDAGWVVRNGDSIDYVTAVEHSKLTAESYQTCAVALDPCSPHEYSEECVYVDSTRHGYSCKWCGVMKYESHAYTEVKPDSIIYSPYYEPCTCGAWKGSYSNLFNDNNRVNVEGVRPLTAQDTVWTAGTYAVCGDVTFDSRVTVSGDVTIILTRTANLTVNGGIEVNDNSETEAVNTNVLTFFKDYSAYQNISKLTVQNVPAHCAGIGGGDGKTAGRIRLSEGYYDITGGEGAPGVGGGYGGGTGKITIASIKAAVIRGGEGAVGIGAGVGGTPEAVNIAVNSYSLIVSGVTAFDIAPSIGSRVYYLMISTGDSADTLTKQTKKDGIAAFTTAKAIKMEVCDHASEGTAYTFLDNNSHYWYCSYCEDIGIQGDHAYDETTHLCACGKIWSNGTDKAYVVSAGESLKTDNTNIILEDMTFGTPEEPVLLELKTKLILGDGVTVTVNGSIKAYDSEITALSYGENMGKLIVQNVPKNTNGILIVANKTLTVSGGDITVSAGRAEGAIGTEIEEGVFLYTGGRVTALSSSETSGGWFAFELDPTINMPYRLYAGDTVDSLELIAEPYREDFSFSHDADVVRLDEPCKSHNYSRDLYYYKDENYHLTTCFDCGASFEENHAFGADNVCVCGYANGVKYLTYDIWGEETWTTESYTGVATLITPYTTKLNDEWCIVRGDVTIGTPTNPVIIRLNCSVELILLDGASLTIYGSLELQGQESYLSVEAQSTGSDMGKLTIKAPEGYPAFGGKSANFPSADYAGMIALSIYGGELDLTGGSGQPAICGGDPYSFETEDCYNLYVYGGKTTARGGSGKEAIGHKCYTYEYRDYYFEMFGGEFTAIGGEGACAFADYKDGFIDINGGKLTAEGGSGKAAFAAIPDIYCEDWTMYIGNSIAALKAPLGLNDRDLELCKTQTAVRLEECAEHNYGPSYSDQSTHNIMCLNCAKLQESAIAHTFDEETGLCVCGAWKGTYLTYDPETDLWSTSEPVIARSVNSADYQWTEGWYVVKGDVTIDRRMIVSGHVRLILADDSSLTVNGGISLIRNHTLTIYAQSTGEHMGSLTAQNAPDDCAGIGGNECLEDMTDFLYGPNNGMYGSSGDLNIYGGRITATAGGWAAGIGDGAYPGGYELGGSARSGDITIYGGVVTATAGGTAPGIGTLTYVDWNYVLEGAKIAIYGGTVNAYGGSHQQNSRDYIPGVGIGGVDLGSVIIYGGTVNAYGGVNLNGNVAPAAGIGSMITDKVLPVVIKGGTLTSVGGEGGSAYDADITLDEGNWVVYAGTSEDELSVVAPADRTDALYTSNQAVRITGCSEHQLKVTCEDATQHRSVCSLCGLTAYTAHTFNEETGLCVCGGWQGTYRAYDAESKSWSTSEPVFARSVTAEDTQWAEGRMVVVGNVTIDRRVAVSGNVELLLTDNSSLTVNGGIAVTYPNTLTIYAQSEGEQMGSLTAQTTETGFAGIGGNAPQTEESATDEAVLYSGSITVYGGAINATGGAENAGGIGDGGAAPSDEALERAITVYGGAVNASGAWGIGVVNGNLYYYGGEITASGASPLMYAPTVYAETWCVYTGTSASDLTLLRKDNVTDQTYTDSGCIGIRPCEQHVGTISYNDPTGHIIGCVYCGEATKLPHDFANGACECGAICTTYLECDADGKNWNTVTNAGVLPYNVRTDTEYPSLSEGWYLVTGTWSYGTAEYSSYSNRITILGDVKLILADGASLNAYAGIEVPANSTLTIYAQSKNDAMGALTAYSPGNEIPAIGAERANTGTINIKGGSITADGSASRGSGTGIGAYRRYGATINIYDGVINATGSTDNPAIGGGGETTEKALNVTIYGGKVTAKGNEYSAGIGTGWNSSSQKLWVCGGITINGGVVNATGGELAAGIGGGYWTGSLPITINGGTVTATGGGNGVGIGDGCDYDVSDRKTYITINGGKVTANGGTWANAIGDNQENSAADRVVIKINGGEIIAVAGAAFSEESPTYAFSVEPIRDLSGYLYSAGASLDTLASIALSDLSTPFCTQNAAVKMVPCTHPDGYSENAAFVDDETHTAGCAYCGESATVDHSFPAESNGFCTVCGAYQPAVLNTDGYYEIGNAGQFLWFSRKIKNGERAINGKLIADISLKDIDLAPISGVYTGIFDGDEHTISDIALAASSGPLGLFAGIGTNAVLKNFTLRGEITCNGKIEMLGGVVGYINGAATIDNVHSYVNISGNGTAYQGTQYIGGIVGYTAHAEEVSIVKNCTYHGTIDIPYAARTGGICGYAGSNTQTLACANYGTVKVGDGYHTGGILGAGQKTLVERCMNYGTVEMKSHDCLGGIVGYATDSTKIKSCGNVGSITGTSTNTGAPDAYVGGILGYINSSAFGELSDCYNYGTITAYAQNTYCGAIIGWGRSGATKAKIINNYYLSGEGVKAFGTINDTTATATAASAEQFASGEIAYLLNGKVIDGTQAWYQELTDEAKKDAYPVISGKTVYYGYRDCRDEAMLYSNTPSTSIKGEHSYDNGFCTVCDAYQPAVKNADDYYEIGNAGQLYWFAALVNGTLTGASMNTRAKGKLIADITVNENVIVNGELSSKSAAFRTWTPIGTFDSRYTQSYSGTFDGNNKTISGLYYSSADARNIGLFGAIDAGTIRDLSVKDTYFGGQAYVGGISGYLTSYWSKITISNCSFDGLIVDLGGNYRSTGFGGIAGGALANQASLVIENCSSSAVIRDAVSRAGGLVGFLNTNGEYDFIIRESCFTGEIGGTYKFGGLIGEVSCNTSSSSAIPQLIDCYNLGSITAQNSAGGLIGVSQGMMLIRCYNAGSVTANNKTGYSIGALIGSGSATFENCYYLEGGALDGAKVAQCAFGNETVGSFTPDEEGVQTTAMSAEQFASGAVTWLLNGQTAEATEENPLTWYQTLDTDSSPRFTGGTVYPMTNTGCPNAPARYSNTANETFVGAHDYGEDGLCACGATVQTILTFEKSLSLQSYVAFNFLVKKDALSDLDDWYMVISRDDAEKGPQTETINGITHRDNIVRFEYKIFSYQMADKLTVTIYGVKDGVTFAGETYTASVADYCMSKIAAADDGMKSVYANLLTYGAKAQLYSGYRADELADSVLGDYASFVTSTVPSVENKAAAASNDVTNLVSLRANAVGIASSVQLQFILTPAEGFDPANVYAEVKWMDNGVESVKQIEGTSFVSNLAGTTYTVVFEDLRADEGRSLVDVTIRDKETNAAVSDTWTYSIESYVAMRQSSANTNLVTMLNALMNYYDAAEAYYGR